MSSREIAPKRTFSAPGMTRAGITVLRFFHRTSTASVFMAVVSDCRYYPAKKRLIMNVQAMYYLFSVILHNPIMHYQKINGKNTVIHRSPTL